MLDIEKPLTEYSSMKIDFREIPPANRADGSQDEFELFARDLFKALGFLIDIDVGRGGDDRKDFIACEKVEGKLSSHENRYLVSCKHFAHSGNQKSVGNSNETDILGRLRIHKCDGFIGFYSTVASSALIREINILKKEYSVEKKTYEIIDHSRIFSLLVLNESTLGVFKKYLPSSFSLYMKNDINSGLYRAEPQICCEICGVNILYNFEGGVVRIQCYNRSYNHFTGREGGCSMLHNMVFYCDNCKSSVDSLIKSKYPYNFDIFWYEILKYTDPMFFIERTMEDVKFSAVFSDYFADIDTFRKWNIFTRSMFYYVSRKYDLKKEGNGASLFFNIDFKAYKL